MILRPQNPSYRGLFLGPFIIYDTSLSFASWSWDSVLDFTKSETRKARSTWRSVDGLY